MTNCLRVIYESVRCLKVNFILISVLIKLKDKIKHNQMAIGKLKCFVTSQDVLTAIHHPPSVTPLQPFAFNPYLCNLRVVSLDNFTSE